MPVNPILAEVTARIEARSGTARGAYLEQIERARGAGPSRGKLSCANWAHAFAARFARRGQGPARSARRPTSAS